MFSETIIQQKYSMNGKENWSDIGLRTAYSVINSLPWKCEERNLADDIARIIINQKFIPGGRYLYAAGRPYHQVANCFLFRAIDSREGWSDLMQKCSMSLMTGGGVGVDYSEVRPEGSLIKGTGGTATGPIALMNIINESGRYIMQGGSRRSAIWAGLNWKHPDCKSFIMAKNWSSEVRDIKERDFNFPAQLDMTNISVLLDDSFFNAISNPSNPNHTLAHEIYSMTTKRMLKTSEPGFSIDIGENSGETLRNAPVSGDTYVLLNNGYWQVKDIVDKEVPVWTGKRYVPTIFKKTMEDVETITVTMSGRRTITCEPNHEFILENNEKVKAKNLQEGDSLKLSLHDKSGYTNNFETTGYTLGFLYGDGSFHKRYPRAEVTLCTEEKKTCSENFNENLIISITNPNKRGYKKIYFKNDNIFEGRHKEIFPEEIHESPLSEQTSFLAGLFDSDGNYFEPQNRIRLSSIHIEFLHGVRRLLESMGILSFINISGTSGYSDSICYNLVIGAEYINNFVELIPTKRLKIKQHSPYRKTKIKVISVEPSGKTEDVFCCDVGVEEHSFMAEGVIISNCTEITSSDDSDLCNLGSINMANIESLEEMEEVVELATIFLLAGTVYGDVPFPKVAEVREKNRRIGLGLMGLHEWLLMREKKYEIDSELEKYLDIYKNNTYIAHKTADKWGISQPIKTRAIAPTGTIAIVAGTTTGIEPLFCSAYKRRYLNGKEWKHQYVINDVAKKIVNETGNPDLIEDAYSIGLERRMKFQVWLQSFVDHAISSTINVPEWGSTKNNPNTVDEFRKTLMKYIKGMRGFTVYSDKSRGGQPLVKVPYQEAAALEGQVFTENLDICDITKAGSCSS